MSPFLLRRLSDEELGGRLASGEAAAFDELYRRYIHRLAAYGAQLLGDSCAGDDVAQSALLGAYGALRAGAVPDRVRPWLYRIAHNAAIDLVRRGRELPSDTLPDRIAAPAPGDAGELVRALASLPDRQRRVYVLRELHGLRVAETAAELGLEVPQVEQALFAARNRMAEHLVFGDRLNCVAVQRLATGPLDLSERRALKTHLRSCAACRAALGRRGRALGVLPLDWLRALGGLLASGGAPVAAKVSVLVAGASVAALPIASERHPQPHLAPVVQVARASVAARRTPAARETEHGSRVVRSTPIRFAPVAREDHGSAHVTARVHAERHHDDTPARTVPAAVRRPVSRRGPGPESGGSTGGHGGGDLPAAVPSPVAPVPATPTTTTTETTTTNEGPPPVPTSTDGDGGGSGREGGGSSGEDGGHGSTSGSDSGSGSGSGSSGLDGKG